MKHIYSDTCAYIFAFIKQIIFYYFLGLFLLSPLISSAINPAKNSHKNKEYRTNAAQVLVVRGYNTPTADSTFLSVPTFEIFKVCTSQDFQLRALVPGAGNRTYRWFDLSGNVISTDSIYIGSLPDATYSVEVKDGSGNILLPPLGILIQICNVSTPPINANILVNGSTSLCTVGSSQTLTLEAFASTPDPDNGCLSEDFTYQWFKEASELTGETDKTLEIQNVPQSAGTYSVIVRNECGGSIPVSVLINTIDVQPSNVSIATDDGTNTICQGKSIFLRAAADDADSYRWFKNGNPAPIGTGSSLSINSPGIYELEAANGCGSKKASKQIFAVDIPQNFSIIASPADGVLCDEPEAFLGVSVAGFTEFYELYKDNVLFETRPDPNFTTSQLGTYKILAYNKCGFRASNTINLGRISPPTFVNIELEGTASPSLSPTCSPPTDSIKLLAISDGTALTYQWYYSPDTSVVEFAEIGGQIGSFLTVKEIGFYYVTAYNKCNPVSSAVLKVVEASDLDAQDISITALGGTISCSGGITLQTDDLGEGVSYQWVWQERDSLRTTTVNHIDIKETGTYTVQAFNACGATLRSSPILLQIEETPANPVILNNGTALVCVESGNEQRTLTAQLEGSNLTYQWFKNGVLYSNTPSITLSAASQSDLSGQYYFKASNVCGMVHSDTVDIRFVAPPQEDKINLLVDACSNSTFVILSVQTSASSPTFDWYRNNQFLTSTQNPSLNVTLNGTYRVNVRNDCKPGGIFSAEVDVEVGKTLPIPQIVSSPISQVNTLCPGNNLTLNVQIPGGFSNLGYRWFRGNQVILGASGSSLEVSRSGAYRVEIFSLSDFTCTQISLPYEVFVRPEPTILLTFRRSLTVCSGDSVLLKTSATSNPVIYQWFRDDILISTQDSIYARENGSYRVEAVYDPSSTGFPCDYVGSQTVRVNVIAPPEPEIVLEGGVLSVLEPEKYDHYQWNRNGIPILGATDVSHLPLDPGDYSVTVRNESDCEGVSQEIFQPGIFLESTDPVQISPNPSQGTFKIVVVSTEESQISIHNALGQVIHSEALIPKVNSISGFGEVKVNILAPGIYIIRAFVDGKFISRKLIVEK